MSEKTGSKHELLKQNMELTLIITFIGLAFGLVGLIVRTAEVMSVVVIAVAVIVGFVSYNDAFRPQPLRQEAAIRPVAQPLPTPPPTAKPQPPLTQTPPPPPTPIRSEPVREPAREREPLPTLPKVQLLSSSPKEVVKTFTPIARPAPPKVATKEQATTPPQQSPTSAQVTKARPPKPRPKKAIEVSQINEKKEE